MVYLLILLAIFLVIGPVFWLRPSKRERELAVFRQVAMSGGAKIQPLNIRTDPVYSGTLARNPHLADYSWVRYQWLAEEGEVGPVVKESWVQRKDREHGLVWEPRTVTTKEPEAVSEILNQWREQQDGRFLSLELGPRNVAVVWTERGDQEELAGLASQVRKLLREH